MSYDYWIIDSRTGVKQVQVFPTGGGWEHRLSGGVMGQTTSFTLSDDEENLVLRDETVYRPWSRAIVYSWNGVAVYAGLIESDETDLTTNVTTITHWDIESFMKDRFPFGVGSYWLDEPGHIPGSITITAKSHEAAVAKLTEQCLLGPAAIYSFNIALPSPPTAGSYTNTFYNYNLQSLVDLLTDFRALGVEIEFKPLWTAGVFGWVLRVSTPTTPILGSVFEFNQTVDEPRLLGGKYTRDGSMMLTGMFGIGEGTEQLMRVGGDGLFGAATIPARDSMELYKTTASEAMLAAYGAAAVAAQTLPARTFSGLQMLATEEPGLENVEIGSVFTLFYNGHPRVPDGPHDTRVIGMSGDVESARVKLDLLVF